MSHLLLFGPTFWVRLPPSEEAWRPINQDLVDRLSGQQWSEAVGGEGVVGEGAGGDRSSSSSSGLIAHSGQAVKPVDYNRRNSWSCVLLWSANATSAPGFRDYDLIFTSNHTCFKLNIQETPSPLILFLQSGKYSSSILSDDNRIHGRLEFCCCKHQLDWLWRGV